MPPSPHMRTKLLPKIKLQIRGAPPMHIPQSPAESAMMTVGKDDTQKVLLKRAKNVFDRVKKGLKRAKI